MLELIIYFYLKLKCKECKEASTSALLSTLKPCGSVKKLSPRPCWKAHLLCVTSFTHGGGISLHKSRPRLIWDSVRSKRHSEEPFHIILSLEGQVNSTAREPLGLKRCVNQPMS